MKPLQRLLSATALMCLTQCAAVAAPAPFDTAARQQVLDSALREMHERYVFPEVAAKAETALRARWQAKALDIADPQRFAEALTAELQAVTHDKHVRVRYSAEALPPRAERRQPSAHEEAKARANESALNFRVERVERLPGNVGYLDLRGFAPLEWAADTLAAAMNLLAHTDALIIDLRRNGGGDPATVAFVCSYLFDERTHLNDLYWREGDRTEQFHTSDWVPGKRFGGKKPVYVLTAKYTFSGAEEFSYNLKTRKRATLVGETTGGGANPGGVFLLDPHFSMFVPTGRAINPITRTNWEGTGVEPDVKVPADEALTAARTLALQKLIADASDAELRSLLQQRLSELQAAR